MLDPLYRSRCIGHLSPLFTLRGVGCLPVASLSTRRTRITWHTSLVHIMLGNVPPVLNLIQYNMSPFLTPPSRREGRVKPGGWLFKTVPISTQRETSSYYDRSNTDWSGQVFYFCGVPVWVSETISYWHILIQFNPYEKSVLSEILSIIICGENICSRARARACVCVWEIYNTYTHIFQVKIISSNISNYVIILLKKKIFKIVF